MAAFACTQRTWPRSSRPLPIGTPVRLINVPVKVACINGELLLEAHPAVDAQGKKFEPDVDQFSDLIREAVGHTSIAIHWDYARGVAESRWCHRHSRSRSRLS